MTSTKDPQDLVFTEALEAFVSAAVTLSSVWQRQDHTGAYFADKYPFEKSFEDVVHDIIEWRDTCNGKVADVGNDPLFGNDVGIQCEWCDEPTIEDLYLCSCSGGASGDSYLCAKHYDSHVKGLTVGDETFPPCDICQPRRGC